MSIIKVIESLKPEIDRVIVYLRGKDSPISGKFISFKSNNYIVVRIPVIPHPSNTEYWNVTIYIDEIAAIGEISK
jgi:hypothetical protein